MLTHSQQKQIYRKIFILYKYMNYVCFCTYISKNSKIRSKIRLLKVFT